jgi:membrane associated rhomboid family serine protease
MLPKKKNLHWAKIALYVVGKPVKAHEYPLYTKPWLTGGLITLISLATIFAWLPENTAAMFGSLAFYPTAEGLQWYTGLFTCALLHGNWAHLFGNMYFFWLFGRHIECQFGKRRMLGLFLISVALGSYFHGLLSDNPAIGASGGIFGLLTFYALLFPKSRILWLPFVGSILRAFSLTWKVLRRGFPVRVYVGFFILLQFVLLYNQLFLDGRISALAHLGGGLAGIIIFFGWKKGSLP